MKNKIIANKCVIFFFYIGIKKNKNNNLNSILKIQVFLNQMKL